MIKLHNSDHMRNNYSRTGKRTVWKRHNQRRKQLDASFRP